jgi:hypothetical protein
MTSTDRARLEDYNVSIQHFHDSLRGLDAAIEEALGRCEKERLACEEARLAYEDEQAKRASSHVSRCPARDAIEEQYLLAVIAYGDAVNNVRLRPRAVNETERQRIEQARTACNVAFKALEDHEQMHACTRARSARGSAKASAA